MRKYAFSRKRTGLRASLIREITPLRKSRRVMLRVGEKNSLDRSLTIRIVCHYCAEVGRVEIRNVLPVLIFWFRIRALETVRISKTIVRRPGRATKGAYGRRCTSRTYESGKPRAESYHDDVYNNVTCPKHTMLKSIIKFIIIRVPTPINVQSHTLRPVLFDCHITQPIVKRMKQSK